MKKEQSLLDSFFQLVVVILALVLSPFAVLDWYTWFIMPLGFPNITVVHSMGISGFLYYTTGGHFHKKADTHENKWVAVVVVLAQVLLFWLFGAVLHWFMVN